MCELREELFDNLVERALVLDEVRGGLPDGGAVTEDMLRQRCASRRDEMWAGIGDLAAQFDITAKRAAKLNKADTASKVVQILFTSAQVQVFVVSVGVLLIAWAFIGVGVGPSGVRAAGLLLGVATVLVAAAGLIELFLKAVASRFSRRLLWLLRVLLKTDPIVLAAIGVTAFYAATLEFISQDELKRNGLSDEAGSLFPVALVVGAFYAAPFLLSILRQWPMATKRLRYFGFLLVVVIGVPALLLFVKVVDAVAIQIAPYDYLSAVTGAIMVAVGGLIATFGGRTPTMSDVRRSYTDALEKASTALTETQLLPFLRQEISRHADDYGVLLEVRDHPGLSQVFDPLYRVPIAAAARVATLLSGMSGGSIGLAGARGSGKTTLIESYCASGRYDEGLAAVVAAPVEYSAREFLLHLYVKVCEEVLGEDHDPARHHERLARKQLFRRRFLGMMGGVVTSGLGGVLTTVPRLSDTPATQLWGAVLVLAGIMVLLAVAVTGLTSVRNSAVFEPSLESRAADRLEEIRFQQSFTATATGTVKLPIGIEGALSRARGLTRQPMNLPEIVESLRRFLAGAAQDRGRVVIGIDEMDKMNSESAAEQFLNEIKGVFGIPGCYFLVSVSEEAMSTFERRGLPFRDVFDSTFDEIVWFEHLTCAEAMTTIDRRVLIPVPFKQLCYVLSGGLPRELVRVTRGVIQAQDSNLPTGLARIADRLVTEDVRRKTRAVAVAARRLDAEPNLSSFLLICDRVRGAVIDRGSLLRLIYEIVPASDEKVENEGFRVLVGELACFYYYSATVLDFFDSGVHGRRWRVAGAAVDCRGLGELVKARQSFSSSTMVAWQGITRFRAAWTLPTLEFPDGIVCAS